MAKVIMMCGKICSGKSTYAEELRKELNAALLSVDEITLAIFGQDIGEKHDEYVEKLERYLFNKALELTEVGINVILDLGLWTKSERKAARDFFNRHGTENEIHYLDITDEEWQQRINKRNADIAAGKVSAYYVDEGLAEKVNLLFEKPSMDEVNLRIQEN